MSKRIVLLCWLLILAGCGSAAVDVVADTTSPSDTEAPSDSEAPVDADAVADTEAPVETTVADEDDELLVSPPHDEDENDPERDEPYVPDPDAPANTQAPEVSVAPEVFDSPAEQLAAEVRDSDFALNNLEHECLASGLAAELTNDQIQELIDRSSDNPEPGDPLIDSVVIAYEQIAGCMGADRIIDVILEPEPTDPFYTCFIEAFPSDEEQIDAMVAIMALELADLPEAPGRYAEIIAKVDRACGNEGQE